MSKKAILISIKPKWVAKILNGEKTIEIRKTMPKCDLPIDVYIYCTKDKEHLYRHFDNRFNVFREYNKLCSHNGKVVAKFTLNKVEEYFNGHKWENLKEYVGSCLDYEEVLKPSCLTDDELYAYNNDLHFFAWHISNLEIFDKPKELSEFRKYYRSKGFPQNRSWNLTKAPQSWQFIEAE